MSSAIYAWKGTNYLSEESADNLKNLLSNPKIYLRFNGFELNNIQEIQRFLTFNNNSREKSVREAINCFKPDKDSPRTPITKLEIDEFQGIVPSFHLDETTISILNDYSGIVGLPKSAILFITSEESYNIDSDSELDKKFSDFSEGTIKANCSHVKTDITETLITPNFNGVIIYLNFNNAEHKKSNFSLLGYISKEIGSQQKDRDYKNLKKNIIISTILASELNFHDKIKLITPINKYLATELEIQYKSYSKSKSKRERESDDDESESQPKAQAQKSSGGKKTKKTKKTKKGKKICKTKKIKSIYRLNKKSKKKIKKVNKKTKNYKKVRK